MPRYRISEGNWIWMPGAIFTYRNWTPTTSISDLLVVVMKKSTAGISIS
ncbi:hypothetical protein MK640_004428 [Escherichia coli]|nr:hypothetical protein [Escherichia coli]